MQPLYKTLFLLLLFLSPQWAQAQNFEYHIKAALLEKIAKFTQWPPNKPMNAPKQPLIICVVGENPFGDLLDRLYSVKKIKDRNVKVLYLDSHDPLVPCHMLYLSSEAPHRFREVIAYAEQNQILTFADNPGWGRKGICINFYVENETVQMEINEKSLKKNTIQINSLLLDYGTIIDR